MDYNFLKYLNNEGLNELEDILLGITSKEELLEKIKILKNKSINISDTNFSSSNIPNYDESLEEKCIEVLKELKVDKLSFFLVSFLNKGNTYDSRLISNYYEDLKDKSSRKDFQSLRSLIYYTYSNYGKDTKLRPPLYLDKVNRIFEDVFMQKMYEGPYNMLNYIKNYIYFLLKQESELTIDDIFTDYQDKKHLVNIRLNDISSYLLEIKNGTNLRLCISNAGLSRNAIKTSEVLTLDQKLFIDALAFGTTLEKIEKRDYEDYKKLLYLPQGKDINK